MATTKTQGTRVQECVEIRRALATVAAALEPAQHARLVDAMNAYVRDGAGATFSLRLPPNMQATRSRPQPQAVQVTLAPAEGRQSGLALVKG